MITYAALAPHPPLIVPEVGGERLSEVQATVDGVRRMAAELAATRPDTIIFLTPHGNCFADALSSLGHPDLKGNLSSFGARHYEAGLKNDLPLLMEIADHAVEAGIPFVIIDQETAQSHGLNPDLDHGILVPLHYLQEAGLKEVNIVAVSIAFLPVAELYRFGSLLRKCADILDRRVAILASGDMSHRLKEEGPYDYHPDGPRFDKIIKDCLADGNVEGVLTLPEPLRNNAGECGYRSIVIMLGALDGLQFTPRIFSYEGPWGVGYLTAGFAPAAARDSLLQGWQSRQRQELKQMRSQESLPVKWARMVLESYVREGKLPELPDGMNDLRGQRAGTFVSLKRHGQLRGCIGTIDPAYGSLAEEIAGNAVSAGTRDPRFLPVEAHELDELVYSVDILGSPQPCERKDLDPQRYGVIVTRGRRRGLLLPDLEGVDTVEEQLQIALQKAGIKPEETYQLERFEVIRHT